MWLDSETYKGCADGATRVKTKVSTITEIERMNLHELPHCSGRVKVADGTVSLGFTLLFLLIFPASLTRKLGTVMHCNNTKTDIQTQLKHTL